MLRCWFVSILWQIVCKPIAPITRFGVNGEIIYATNLSTYPISYFDLVGAIDAKLGNGFASARGR